MPKMEAEKDTARLDYLMNKVARQVGINWVVEFWGMPSQTLRQAIDDDMNREGEDATETT